MKLSIVLSVAALAFVAVPSFADVGDGTLLKCGSLDHVSFEIHNTAVPKLKQGTLSSRDGDTVFNCKRFKREAPKGGDQESILWRCIENRSGDGKWIVTVTSPGLAGRIMAEVSLEQIYPLPSQPQFSLFCEQNSSSR